MGKLKDLVNANDIQPKRTALDDYNAITQAFNQGFKNGTIKYGDPNAKANYDDYVKNHYKNSTDPAFANPRDEDGSTLTTESAVAAAKDRKTHPERYTNSRLNSLMDFNTWSAIRGNGSVGDTIKTINGMRDPEKELESESEELKKQFKFVTTAENDLLAAQEEKEQFDDMYGKDGVWKTNGQYSNDEISNLDKEYNRIKADIQNKQTSYDRQKNAYDTAQASHQKRYEEISQQNANKYKSLYEAGAFDNAGDEPIDLKSMSGSQLKAYQDSMYEGGTIVGKGETSDIRTDRKDQYAVMNGDERKIYTWLYNNSDPNTANEYLNSIGAQLNSRMAKIKDEGAYDYASEHPFLSLGTASVKSVVGGVKGTAEGLKQAWGNYNNQLTKPLDINAPGFDTSRAKQQYSTAVKDTYGDTAATAWNIGESIGENLVKLPAEIAVASLTGGSSAVASLAGKAFATASLIDMSMGAASSAMVDATQRGLDSSDAVSYGTIIGAIEYATEKMGFDNAVESVLKGKGKSTLWNMTKQMLPEGMEESASNVLDTITDVQFFGGESEFMQGIAEYKKANPGASDSEAFAHQIGQQGLSMLEDFAGGAISGGVLGGVNLSIHSFGNSSQMSDAADYITNQIVLNSHDDVSPELQKEIKANIMSAFKANDGMSNSSALTAIANAVINTAGNNSQFKNFITNNGTTDGSGFTEKVVQATLNNENVGNTQIETDIQQTVKNLTVATSQAMANARRAFYGNDSTNFLGEAQLDKLKEGDFSVLKDENVARTRVDMTINPLLHGVKLSLNQKAQNGESFVDPIEYNSNKAKIDNASVVEETKPTIGDVVDEVKGKFEGKGSTGSIAKYIKGEIEAVDHKTLSGDELEDYKQTHEAFVNALTQYNNNVNKVRPENIKAVKEARQMMLNIRDHIENGAPLATTTIETVPEQPKAKTKVETKPESNLMAELENEANEIEAEPEEEKTSVSVDKKGTTYEANGEEEETTEPEKAKRTVSVDEGSEVSTEAKDSKKVTNGEETWGEDSEWEKRQKSRAEKKAESETRAKEKAEAREKSKKESFIDDTRKANANATVNQSIKPSDKKEINGLMNKFNNAVENDDEKAIRNLGKQIQELSTRVSSDEYKTDIEKSNGLKINAENYLNGLEGVNDIELNDADKVKAENLKEKLQGVLDNYLEVSSEELGKTIGNIEDKINKVYENADTKEYREEFAKVKETKAQNERIKKGMRARVKVGNLYIGIDGQNLEVETTDGKVHVLKNVFDEQGVQTDIEPEGYQELIDEYGSEAGDMIDDYLLNDKGFRLNDAFYELVGAYGYKDIEVYDQFLKNRGIKVYLYNDAHSMSQGEYAELTANGGDYVILNVSNVDRLADLENQMSFVLGHEVGHRIAGISPNLYNDFTKLIDTHFKKEFDEEYKYEKQKRIDLSKRGDFKTFSKKEQKAIIEAIGNEDDIREEAYCNMIGKLYSRAGGPAFFNEVLELNNKKATKTIRKVASKIGVQVNLFRGMDTVKSNEIADAIESLCKAYRNMAAKKTLKQQYTDVQARKNIHELYQEAKTDEPTVSELVDEVEMNGDDPAVLPINHEDGIDNPVGTKQSVSATLIGLGLNWAKDSEGNPLDNRLTLLDKNGKKITHITGEELSEMDSPLTYAIGLARKYGTIDGATADYMYDLYASFVNKTIEFGDKEEGISQLDAVWRWYVANEYRKPIKKNSDEQYGTSHDLTTICTKTQQIIYAMSEFQKVNKRGVQAGDVYQLIREIGKGVVQPDGTKIYYQTPCPACFVFSKWLDRGKFMQIYYSAQQKYKDHLLDYDVVAKWEADGKHNKVKEYYDWWLKELKKQEKYEKDNSKVIETAKRTVEWGLEMMDYYQEKLSQCKTASERKGVEAQIKECANKYQQAMAVVSNSSMTGFIKKSVLSYSTDKNTGKIKINRVTDFKFVPDDILFDFMADGELQKNYSCAARYFATRGNGAGKEIQSDSNNDFGDVISGIATGANLKGKNNLLQAYELKQQGNIKEADKKLKAFEKDFNNAIIKSEQQEFRGANRVFSWSDNRLNLAEDLLLNLAQFQMIGSGIQSYTKQIEAAKMFGVTGAYNNGSLIAYGNGFVKIKLNNANTFKFGDENPVDALENVAKKYNISDAEKLVDEVFNYGAENTAKKYKVKNVEEFVKDVQESMSGLRFDYIDDDGNAVRLTFSDVQGIDNRALSKVMKQYDTVGNILIGMNEEHMEYAMASDRIMFIIPWHASGNTNKELNTLLEIHKEPASIEGFNHEGYNEESVLSTFNDASKKVFDHIYQRVQNEGLNIPSSDKLDFTKSYGEDNELTDAQKKYRKVRSNLMLANDWKKISKSDMAIIDADEYLLKIKEALTRKDGSKLPLEEKDIPNIRPVEYWDTSSTFGNADINGTRYLEYCRRLGYVPKFCGIDTGEMKYTGRANYIDKRGYWKTLIDRPMYDNQGNYQEMHQLTMQPHSDSNGEHVATIDLADPYEIEKNTKVSQQPNIKDAKKIAISTTENLENRKNGLANGKIDVTEAGQKKAIKQFTSKGYAEWENAVNEFGEYKKTKTKHSLRVVTPIEPSNSLLWSRDLTEAEVREMGYPIYEDAKVGSEERGNDNTQIPNTKRTYANIFNQLKVEHPNDWQNMRILDASSGLGYGTQVGREMGFDVTDIEPYPNKDKYVTGKPNYTDYSQLEKLVADGKVEPFDYIISNAVLNVVPQDTRDNLVSAMNNLLKPDGQMFVNVRGATEDNIKNAREPDGVKKGTVLLKKGNKGQGNTVYVYGSNSIQKGFTPAEFKAYMIDALGDGYTFERTKAGSAQSGVFAKSNSKHSFVSNTNRAYADALEKGDMDTAARLVKEAAEKNGYDTFVYHGSTRHGWSYYDINASDDGISIFITPDMSIARTYSGVEGTRDIQPAKKSYNVDNEKGAIDFLKEYFGDDYVKLKTDEERKYYAERLIYRANRMLRGITEQGFKNWLGKKGALPIQADANKIVDFYNNLRGAYAFSNEIYNTVSNARDLYGAASRVLTPEQSGAEYVAKDIKNVEPYRAALKHNQVSDYYDEYNGKKAGNYGLYAKLGKTLVVDAQGHNWATIPIIPEMKKWLEQQQKNNTREYNRWYDKQSGGLSSRGYAAYAKDNGYDSVRIDNVWDEGGRYSEGQEKPGTIIATFDPKRIKSAQTVTYDDNGEVIPLSKRFNSRVNELRYSFAGEKANLTTDMRKNLEQAKARFTKGDSAEDILKDTGWVLNQNDGKWRYELDDSKATFTHDFNQIMTDYFLNLGKLKGKGITAWKNGNKTLGDLLQYDELFNLYPELKDIKVKLKSSKGNLGTYIPSENTLEVSLSKDHLYYLIYAGKNVADDAKQTLLHEIQHAIQHKEGFAKGSSRASEFLYEFPNYNNAVKEAKENFDWLLDTRNDHPNSGISMMILDARDGIKQNEAKVRANIKDASDEFVKEFTTRINEFADQEKSLNSMEKTYKSNMRNGVYESRYKRSQGEIESRDVESRMGLSSNERRSNVPESTKYNPDAIVRWADEDTKYSFVNPNTGYTESKHPTKATVQMQGSYNENITTERRKHNSQKNILVACEESQRTCSELRKLGFNAFSCDTEDPSGGHPEWHIKGDALKIIDGKCTFQTMDGKTHTIKGKWDGLIAHPPCTYLSVSGNAWYNIDKYGDEARQRIKDREDASEFFMSIANADCDHIAIENPIGIMSTRFQKPSQIIQPYQFYDGNSEDLHKKTTCLWLKGLPNLQAVTVDEPNGIEYNEYTKKDGSKTKFDKAIDSARASDDRSKQSSVTYPGVAKAFAYQWENSFGTEMGIEPTPPTKHSFTYGKAINTVSAPEIERANSIVEKLGTGRVQEAWNKMVASGVAISDSDLSLGSALYNKLLVENKKAEADRVFSDLAVARMAKGLSVDGISKVKNKAYLYDSIYKKAGVRTNPTVSEPGELLADIKAKANMRSNTNRRLVTALSQTKTFADNPVKGESADSRWVSNNKSDKPLKITHPSDIVNYISDAFHIPISTGNVFNDDAAGVFKSLPKTIRTQIANNLPTVFHELGHALEDKYNVSSNFTPQEISLMSNFIEQIRPGWLAQTHSDVFMHELMAEVTREYASNPTQLKSAIGDKAYSKYESAVPNEMQEVQKLAQTYFGLDFSERVNAAVHDEKDTNPKRKISFRTAGERFYIDQVDEFFAIKKATDQVLGKNAKGSASAYVQAINSYNSDSIANYCLKENLRDINGNVVGESFAKTIENIKPNELKAFGNYLLLNHALEWLDGGEYEINGETEVRPVKRVFADDSLQDIEKIKEQIKSLDSKYKHFGKTAERVYKYQRQLLRAWAQEGGAINQNAMEKLLAMYPKYIPIFRMSKAGMSLTKVGNRFANLKNPVQLASGSGEEIMNPILSIMSNTHKMVKFGLRNRVMQTLGSYADTVPGFGNMMEYIATKQNKLDSDSTQLHNAIDNDSTQAPDELTGLIDNVITNNNLRDQGEQIISVLVNGEERYYKINDRNLFNAVADMSIVHPTNWFQDKAQRYLRFTSELMTQFNPFFGAANLIRDYKTFLKQSKYTTGLKLPAQYVQALTQILKNSETYQLYKRMGGGNIQRVAMDSYKKAVKDLYYKDANKATKVARAMVDSVTEFNEIIETIPRYIEFSKSLETGNDAEQALVDASDVTTNFNRHGRVGGKINKYSRFYNAAVQGVDKLGRSMFTGTKEELARFWTKAILSALASVLFQRWWNRDDEKEYNELSNYKKNNNICLSVGNGKFITIPKGRENDMLDSALERTFERFFDENPDAYEGFLSDYIYDNILPGGIPTAWLPDTLGGDADLVQGIEQIGGSTAVGGMIDVALNRDYLGRQIVSDYVSKYVPTRDQYDDDTSLAAYGIGHLLKISPLKIDHVMGEFGIAGELAQAVPYNDGKPFENIGDTVKATGIQMARSRFYADNTSSNDEFNFLKGRSEKALFKYQNDDKNTAAGKTYESLQLAYHFISTAYTNAYDETDPDKQRESKRHSIELLHDLQSKCTKAASYLSKIGSSMDNSMMYNGHSLSYGFTLPKDEFEETKKLPALKLTPDQYYEAYNRYLDAIIDGREALVNSVEWEDADSTERTQMLKQLSSDVAKQVNEDTCAMYGRQ